MSTLTDAQAALFLAPNIGSVATIRDDGSAHLTPAWVDWDGEHVLVNTVVGRVKERHIRSGRPVSVLVVDANDPARYVSVTGPATLSTDGAVDHIDAMANKYLGLERYLPEFGEPGDVRVIARIEPTLVTDWNI
jgi:PPOX class probable F420-dependent enzyme